MPTFQPWVTVPADPALSVNTQAFLSWVQQSLNSLVAIVPLPPPQFTVSSAGAGTALLSWNQIVGASAYQIFSSLSPLPTGGNPLVTVPQSSGQPTNSYLQTNILNDAVIYYAMATVNASGQVGPLSPFVAFSPVSLGPKYFDMSNGALSGVNPVANTVAIPAGTLHPGDLIRIFGGIFRTSGVQTPQAKLLMLNGTAPNHQLAINTFAATDIGWQFAVDLFVVSVGTSGTFSEYGLAVTGPTQTWTSNLSILTVFDTTQIVQFQTSLVGTITDPFFAGGLVSKLIH